MRDNIEFRGIVEKTGGKWAYGGFVKKSSECLYIIEYPENPLNENEILIMPIIPDTFGQYTGIKDKNGVKIFEGDILRIGSDGFLDKDNILQKEPSYIAEIVHCRMAWDARKKDGKLFSLMDIYFLKGNIALEVIGNMYGNPELLD